MNVEKLIKIFQTQYKLKDYIPQSETEIKIRGLDEDALFVYIIKCIIYYHILKETEISHVPEFEKAYEMVAKVNKGNKIDWYLCKDELNTIIITKILDVIFLKLRDVMATFQKLEKKGEESLENWIFSISWVNNMSYITLLLFHNTDIIPKELNDMLFFDLGVDLRKSEILFKNCKNIFQKAFFGSKYNVCNIILKDKKESKSLIQPYISLDTISGIKILLGITINLFGTRTHEFDDSDYEVADKLLKYIKRKSKNNIDCGLNKK
jgi:hypothetical protein